jgi:hypothetical protein
MSEALEYVKGKLRDLADAADPVRAKSHARAREREDQPGRTLHRESLGARTPEGNLEIWGDRPKAYKDARKAIDDEYARVFDRSKNLGKHLHPKKVVEAEPAAEEPSAPPIGEKFRSMKEISGKRVSNGGQSVRPITGMIGRRG